METIFAILETFNAAKLLLPTKKILEGTYDPPDFIPQTFSNFTRARTSIKETEWQGEQYKRKIRGGVYPKVTLLDLLCTSTDSTTTSRVKLEEI